VNAQKLHDGIVKLHSDAIRLLTSAVDPATNEQPSQARVACTAWLAAVATLLRDLEATGVPPDEPGATYEMMRGSGE